MDVPWVPEVQSFRRATEGGYHKHCPATVNAGSFPEEKKSLLDGFRELQETVSATDPSLCTQAAPQDLSSSFSHLEKCLPLWGLPCTRKGKFGLFFFLEHFS